MRIMVAAIFWATLGMAGHGQAGAPNSGASAVRPAAPSFAGTLWLTGNHLRLKTKVYASTKLARHPLLIVVLHGDSPFAPPSYQYAFAHKAAAQMDNAIVAAVLRPGYKDGDGDRSQGERGLTTGDNYTPQVVKAVAQVIEQLRKRFHPAAILLVGHSGGAAISADVLAISPKLAQGALLISCPCDLPAFRAHMYKQQGSLLWLQPVKSLSALDLAKRVPRSARVQMIVGSEDDVAPLAMTQEYAQALRNNGVNVSVTIAPGLKHNILLEPVVFEHLKQLAAALR